MSSDPLHDNRGIGEASVITVGTIQHWWDATRRYPAQREICLGFLKPIGYCFVFEQIERLQDTGRVLEFGHGFNRNFFAQLAGSHEVHGIDDYQALHYFPEREGWEKAYGELTGGFPDCHFHRGLLGKGRNDLPDDYFDVVCSVSVMEELEDMDELAGVIADAHRILRPGGYFINSFDFEEHSTEVLNRYLKLQVMAGFSFESLGKRSINLQRPDMAYEDQRVVMHYYLGWLPDEKRKWTKNWCTLLTVSRAMEAQEESPREGFYDRFSRLLGLKNDIGPTVTFL